MIFNNFWILSVFQIISFILSVSAETCKPQINRVVDLKKSIFCNYDSSIIAKTDKSKNATKINVGFTFNYFDFNHWDNTVTIAHWLVMKWTEENLTWNPDLFDGIEEINVNVDELWMPDLTIYNPSGMYNSMITHPSVNCDLNHKGFVICVIPNSYYTLCKSNHLNFPYDEHECTLRFGSLLYSKKNVDIQISKMQNYMGTLNNKNLEWNVTNVTGKIKERIIDSKTNDSMQEISFTFRFARHSSILEATLIIPMLVIIIFTILPFFMSPIENERFVLIIFNIFAHIITFYWIPWRIPQSGNTTPLIVSYYRDSLFVSSLVLIESAIACWIDKKSTRIPESLLRFLQIIFEHKNWILLTVPGDKHKESEEESANVTSNGVDESDLKTEPLDSTTISIQKPSSEEHNWHILRLFLDRLFICVVIFLYIILFITHVPK